MKKSIIYDFVPPDTEGAPLDRYQVFDFVEDTNSFLDEYYASAIKLESHIGNIAYIEIQGSKTADFIRYAIKLRRSVETMKIHLDDSYDAFHIIISLEEGVLTISEEDKDELINLARLAGFYINVNTERGVIIAKCDLHFSDTVAIRAMSFHSAFYHELISAFARGTEER